MTFERIDELRDQRVVELEASVSGWHGAFDRLKASHADEINYYKDEVHDLSHKIDQLQQDNLKLMEYGTTLKASHADEIAKVVELVKEAHALDCKKRGSWYENELDSLEGCVQDCHIIIDALKDSRQAACDKALEEGRKIEKIEQSSILARLKASQQAEIEAVHQRYLNVESLIQERLGIQRRSYEEKLSAERAAHLAELAKVRDEAQRDSLVTRVQSARQRTDAVIETGTDNVSTPSRFEVVCAAEALRYAAGCILRQESNGYFGQSATEADDYFNETLATHLNDHLAELAKVIRQCAEVDVEMIDGTGRVSSRGLDDCFIEAILALLTPAMLEAEAQSNAGNNATAPTT